MRKKIFGFVILFGICVLTCFGFLSCTKQEDEQTIIAKNEKVLEQENEEGSNKASSENLTNTEKNKINDEEFVFLDLSKDGVHFPIGTYDDGRKPELTGFSNYYDERGKVITEGFLNKSYYIAKYEVTYRLWKKVYDWATTGAGKNKGYVFNKGKAGFSMEEKNEGNLNENHPVTNVNWYDCIVWCNAYSEMCGAVPVYYKKEILGKDGKIKPENLKNAEKFILINAKKEKKACDSLVCLTAKELGFKNKENGFRLPIWLEWQLAARLTDEKSVIVEKQGQALHCTVNGKKYFFAKGKAVSGGKYTTRDCQEFAYALEDLAKYANYGVLMSKEFKVTDLITFEVGSLNPNSLGIYDMSGNVDEWCLDYYPKSPRLPAGRVLQGGGCKCDVGNIGLGQQGFSTPSKRNQSGIPTFVYGLRLAKTK